jgi:adenylyl-sulfate kinase
MPDMSFTLWFTGLPASGKTTLARGIYEKIKHKGAGVEWLDSDLVRPHFAEYLGHLKEDRQALALCLGFISSVLNKHHIISIVSSTSPRAEVRERVRSMIEHFVEIYCQCPLEAAERRDTKKLYKMARDGLIHGFTGIDEAYEEPESPEITVHTDIETVEESVSLIGDYVQKRFTFTIGDRGRQ